MRRGWPINRQLVPTVSKSELQRRGYSAQGATHSPQTISILSTHCPSGGGRLLLAAFYLASATTIPAGTPLLVRTNDTISSDDMVGKTFTTQLAAPGACLTEGRSPGGPM